MPPGHVTSVVVVLVVEVMTVRVVEVGDGLVVDVLELVVVPGCTTVGIWISASAIAVSPSGATASERLWPSPLIEIMAHEPRNSTSNMRVLPRSETMALDR